MKKQKYVYYHCTGNRGKCPESYTRQEVLTENFASILKELVIPPPILEWLNVTVLESDRTEQAARELAINKLQAQHARLESRIEVMYLDKLDGRITEEFFNRQVADTREKQDALQRKVREIQTASPAPIDETIDILQLTSRASALFLSQPPAEQRRLLQIVLDKATWQDGTLCVTLFEPFNILRHSNRESDRSERENGGSGGDLQFWLPGMDSNHDSRLQRPLSYH